MPKKVLFVTGSLSDGGAEKVMSILASSSANNGADVELIVLRNKRITYTVSNKVKIVQLKKYRSFSEIKRIIELRREIKKFRPDAIIPFLPVISLYTLIANFGLKYKLIFSERGDPRVNIDALKWKDRIGHLLMRKLGLFRLASWMVFQTPDAQDYYGKRILNKSSIIPNPLDVDNLPEPYNEEREKRIVAAGRFSPEKNFELLIKAFNVFHKYHPDYYLSLYGEGGLRSNYERLVKEFNLETFVEMPGFVADLPEKIRKASMYISTSNHEGISNVMLEALGMGIPSIVTDCPVGGARMFVRSNYNGFLIPVENETALVEAMNSIACDTQLAHEFSKNAVKIREELSATEISKRWLALV